MTRRRRPRAARGRRPRSPCPKARRSGRAQSSRANHRLRRGSRSGQDADRLRRSSLTSDESTELDAHELHLVDRSCAGDLAAASRRRGAPSTRSRDRRELAVELRRPLPPPAGHDRPPLTSPARAAPPEKRTAGTRATTNAANESQRCPRTASRSCRTTIPKIAATTATTGKIVASVRSMAAAPRPVRATRRDDDDR